MVLSYRKQHHVTAAIRQNIMQLSTDSSRPLKVWCGNWGQHGHPGCSLVEQPPGNKKRVFWHLDIRTIINFFRTRRLGTAHKSCSFGKAHQVVSEIVAGHNVQPDCCIERSQNTTYLFFVYLLTYICIYCLSVCDGDTENVVFLNQVC